MLMRIWNLVLLLALYLPRLPGPWRWKAEPTILDTDPLPAELYQKLSCTLSQLHFPARLRGRCSQPHFTVEIPEAQRAEVTLARLQRKLVAELPLKHRCPSPASGPLSSLRCWLPPCPTLRHRDAREAFSRKGGTRDSFLATVYVGGINIHPGAAEIHSAGTETREKGTDHICLQWANPAPSLAPHSPAFRAGESLITD